MYLSCIYVSMIHVRVYVQQTNVLSPPQGCQRNVEDWQRVLQVRSLVLSQEEELKGWIKFSSICRKSGKLILSERTLLNLLSQDPACTADEPLSRKYPQVGVMGGSVLHMCHTCAVQPSLSFSTPYYSSFFYSSPPLSPPSPSLPPTSFIHSLF